VRRTLLLLVLPFCSSCNSTDSGSIQIVIGEETNTFTETPVPAQIAVYATDSTTGTPSTSTLYGPAPYTGAATIDLGLQNEDDVATITFEGLDANGNALIGGQSVEVQYGALAGSTMPIFVQRLGQNARVPNPMADGRQAPLVAVLSERFLIEAGGSDSSLSSTTNVYDFAQFDELSGPPTLPIVPLSMPIVDTVGLLIGSDTAEYYDFSGESQPVPNVAPPTTGGTFGWQDVAGGQTIYDAYYGYAYVVGATRTSGNATAAVLVINTNDLSNSSYPSGNLSWVQLTEPRLGASAALLEGTGIAVGGGSTSGAGLELVAAGASGATNGAPTPSPYPADPSTGSGMAAAGSSSSLVIIAGGVLPSGADAGVRLLDINCSANCTPTVWSPLPEPLTLCSAFAWSAAQGFLVGSEVASGLTHTFFLTTTGVTEVPLKVPHTNAVGFLSPVGSYLVVGGNDAGEFESFLPVPVTGVQPDAGAGDAATD
jgi:hypothetical protein